jgi:hypothetical protein
MTIERSPVRSPRLALIALLTLSSCGALDGAVDHAAERTEALVVRTAEEIDRLKDEIIIDIGGIKTEIIEEVGNKIEEVAPVVVDTALNTEAVAFLIVAVTFLLGLVVIVALVLLLGATRALYAKWRKA